MFSLKKLERPFLLGFICGTFILYFADGYLWSFTKLETINKIITFPASVVFAVDRVLHFFCDMFRSDACRGLGLDGGPLEWVEWLSMYLAMGVVYAFIFVGIRLFLPFLRRVIKKDAASPK